MRVQLSILLFVGLFVGLLAVKQPDHCFQVHPEAGLCPAKSSPDQIFPIPGKCGKFMTCYEGCPMTVLRCPDCKPFDLATNYCKYSGPKCDQCS